MKKILLMMLILITSMSVQAQQGYWNGDEFVELTLDESIVYKYVQAMNDESQDVLNNLYKTMSETGDRTIIKRDLSGSQAVQWYVKKDYTLPEGDYYESYIYKSSKGGHILILPEIFLFPKEGAQIEGLLDYLGNKVQVDTFEDDVFIRYGLGCNVKTSDEVLEIIKSIYEFCAGDIINVFGPLTRYLDSQATSKLKDDDQEPYTESLIFEMDWPGIDYIIFDLEDTPYEATAEGLAITNTRQMEHAWETSDSWGLPTGISGEKAFSTEKGHDYLVRLTVKVPSDGIYYIALGEHFSANSSACEIPVTASDDFQVINVDFPNFGFDLWGDASVTLGNGWVVGTTVVKKVEVFEVPRSRANTQLGYWASGKFIELTPDDSYNYRYVQTLDEESEKTLDDLMADAADEAILKFIENRYFVKKDYSLPEVNMYESPIYSSSEEGIIIICPRIVVSMKEGYEIDGILEQLGSKVTVERSETAYEGGIRYYLACQMNSSEEVLEAVRIISGFVESGGIRYFEPEMYDLSLTYSDGEGSNLIDMLKGGGETAIKGVKAPKADDTIYNLQGQKVSPSYKGIVIQNGKKRIAH